MSDMGTAFYASHFERGHDLYLICRMIIIFLEMNNTKVLVLFESTLSPVSVS